MNSVKDDVVFPVAVSCSTDASGKIAKEIKNTTLKRRTFANSVLTQHTLHLIRCGEGKNLSLQKFNFIPNFTNQVYPLLGGRYCQNREFPSTHTRPADESTAHFCDNIQHFLSTSVCP